MDPERGPTGLENRIRRLASRQHGEVSRAQLLSFGLGADAIKYRLRTGRLIASARGVYSVGIGPRTRERRWAVALLRCGRGAVLSHLSAAALWALRPVDPVTIDISVPRRGVRARDGIRLHRPRSLGAQDVTRRHGLPVTSLPRTLIDLAEVLSTRSLERALDEAEYLKLLHEASVHAALTRNAGRTGAKRLRALLRRHEPGSTRTQSPLEEDFYVLVLANGFPQPLVNEELGPFTVDFLWPEQRLAVETDGGASHDRRSQRKRDARRDAWLAAHDYETLRFTWEQVHLYTAEVLAALTAKLAREP